MTTPVIIISLLVLPFILFAFIGRLMKTPYSGTTGAVLGLSAAFLFFGVGHFALTQSMMEMLPPLVPFKELLVYATGLLEFGLAGLLLHPRTRKTAGLLCIAVLVCFYPVNIYAAFNYTGLGGHVWGPEYLLIRTPLQILLICWTWWFVVRSDREVALSRT